MKRASLGIALGLLAGFGTAQPAFAQWSPGVAAGGTYGNVSGSSVVSSSSRWGGVVGVNLAYMGGSFLARVEGNFVGKGGDQVIFGGDSTGISYSFNYVEVPLLVGPIFHLGDDWAWELFTGFQVGFSTSCKVTVGTAGASDCASDLPGGAEQSTVFSVPFGTSLDYQIPESSTKFVFDVRYFLGLSDALQSAALKTRGFQFMLRLQFGG